MKYALLGLALMLSACTDLPENWTLTRSAPATEVTVWGRVWTITQPRDKPGFYKAVRHENGLSPFGPPARLRTHQAIRAFHAATGCKAIYSSMYQTISGAVFAQLNCTKGG
ncbi:hypothetical protein [Antarcticimicrobium sediminis]|uniref:Lipoprotein n=1 Tax=Antarcticimicrobium sediminis TaxID=2546227 RepID=A0A4V2Z7A2_9RHOB|nr:hypothetical protein [Antarcticimicrobium sediminis]TDE35596.1 hypothetical protein E1B25_16710 [Antarcticimicrobium sediminis]